MGKKRRVGRGATALSGGRGEARRVGSSIVLLRGRVERAKPKPPLWKSTERRPSWSGRWPEWFGRRPKYVTVTANILNDVHSMSYDVRSSTFRPSTKIFVPYGNPTGIFSWKDFTKPYVYSSIEPPNKVKPAMKL